MKQIRPFLDHYGAHDISPVAQDISDRRRHFERRGSLYRSLRIPSLYVRGRNVIELGPGSGYNSIFTQSLAPRRYVLVDANPRGLRDTRAILEQTFPAARNYEIVESLVEDFETSERFELVLAEGLVAFQLDPGAFIRGIARFTAMNGIVVFTCSDAAGLMGEIGRRLIAYKFVDPALPYAERVRRLAALFTPHLATLKAMSRPVEDWIHDNIVHPFVGKTFGIDEAIDALSDTFEIYGSSPEFITDLRWYKELHGDQRLFNSRASHAYHENVLNFLDYRVTVAPHDVGLGHELQQVARTIYATMQRIEESEGGLSATLACADIRLLARLAAPSPRTAQALDELADTLENDSLADPNERWTEFPSFFGRAMQYLSFVRVAPEST
jgi:SAM-dependent methyltransferase